MFNLVKYRYAFLLLSLIVIVPGFISLLIFHLDVGIDFLGGANIQLRPQQKLTEAQLKNDLKSLNLGDLQIVPGSNTTLTPNKIVWIRLDKQVDGNVSSTVAKDLQNKYGTSIAITSRDVPVSPGSKTYYTLIVATGFSTVPKVSDIQSLLKSLPKTTPPGSSTTPTPTPVPTPTPTATSSVAVTPTATATSSSTSTSTTSGSGTIPVSVKDIQQGTVADLLTIQTTTALTTSDIAKIQALVSQNGGPYLYLVSNSTVGPAVAQQTTLYAITAVLAASAFILLYIWFSFRKLPKAYRYGACAIIAMLHDVLVVVGIFSILGKLFGIQIDALFITALLTIVGFSVHDTIVVFDRVRENLLRRTSETFEQVVNASLVQTLARSLNTSLTVLFTLLALTLFTGAGSVHNFTLALLIGIFSGTYSSIFNASMLLVMWEKGELGFNHLGGGEERETRRQVRERELARSRG